MNYKNIANKDTLQKVTESLTKNGFKPVVVQNGVTALSKIKELIPKGVSVMNGSSRTLEEIGYIEYLKSGNHPWNNLHATILEEKDPEKQTQLRKESVNSDYYLGSVHALTENGELLIASNSGSQLPHLAYTSKNIILVVGVQKIVKDIKEGFERIENYVVSLENERMMNLKGYGTQHSKTLILHKENPKMGREVHVLLVEESLGF